MIFFLLSLFVCLSSSSSSFRFPISDFEINAAIESFGFIYRNRLMERIIAANDRICFINQKDDDSKSPMYKCEGLFADFLRKFKPSHGQLKSVDANVDTKEKHWIV